MNHNQLAQSLYKFVASSTHDENRKRSKTNETTAASFRCHCLTHWRIQNMRQNHCYYLLRLWTQCMWIVRYYQIAITVENLSRMITYIILIDAIPLLWCVVNCWTVNISPFHFFFCKFQKSLTELIQWVAEFIQFFSCKFLVNRRMQRSIQFWEWNCSLSCWVFASCWSLWWMQLMKKLWAFTVFLVILVARVATIINEFDVIEVAVDTAMPLCEGKISNDVERQKQIK